MGKPARTPSLAAITAGGLAILLANTVSARGPDIGSPYEILSPNFSRSGPIMNEAPPSAHAPAFKRAASAAGLPVCVRLCDGAFFPVATRAGKAAEEAECRSLCPDADAAVYVLPNGADDDIGRAVSNSGKPYSELPTALGYRTALDAACACHRNVAPHYSIAGDPTLRKGDYVMTGTGIVVFEGAAGPRHRPSDFVGLYEARLSPAARNAIEALQGPRSIAPHGRIRVTTP